MPPAEAIKSVLESEGRSMRSMAIELGITAQGLGNRLSGDMKVSSLCQMADVLGYKVVLAPRDEKTGGIELDAQLTARQEANQAQP